MLFRAIDDYGGTLCWLPNFAYNHCARRIRQRDLEGLSAATMRMFINCSEPVYHESHELFAERFAPLGVTPSMLAVSYAMAENTFAVTQTPPGEPPRLDVIDRAALQSDLRAVPVERDHPNAVIKVSCGKPISGAAVRVLDGDGKPLPERVVGEIAVRSDSMLSGYYHAPGFAAVPRRLVSDRRPGLPRRWRSLHRRALQRLDHQRREKRLSSGHRSDCQHRRRGFMPGARLSSACRTSAKARS